MMDKPKCSITGHECGTDTWNLNNPPNCWCGNLCREIDRLTQENERIKSALAVTATERERAQWCVIESLTQERDRLRELLLQFIEYVEQDTEWPDIVAEGRAALGTADQPDVVK